MVPSSGFGKINWNVGLDIHLASIWKSCVKMTIPWNVTKYITQNVFSQEWEDVEICLTFYRQMIILGTVSVN